MLPILKNLLNPSAHPLSPAVTRLFGAKHDPIDAMHQKRQLGPHGGVAPDIQRSATFDFPDLLTMASMFAGEKGPKENYFLYSRHFNPTIWQTSKLLAAMEGTESAMCVASGMAAITCTTFHLCQKDDHIVSSNTIYGGTHAFFEEFCSEKMGVTTTFVDPTDTSAFENAIIPETKFIFVETMSNPTLKIADIKKLAEITKARKIKLVVDNTFLPLIVSPAALGADFVIHSLTKFINGKSDNIAGVVCGPEESINGMMDLHRGPIMLLGPTMDPRTAYDIDQQLSSLAVRMREHSRRALTYAANVEKLNVPVFHPALDSFPQRELVESMFDTKFGFGGMFTIDCRTAENAAKLINELKICGFAWNAVSLGFYDTLMSCSGSTTSSEISEEAQKAAGLSPGLVRFSAGLTGNLEKHTDALIKAIRKILLTNTPTHTPSQQRKTGSIHSCSSNSASFYQSGKTTDKGSKNRHMPKLTF